MLLAVADFHRHNEGLIGLENQEKSSPAKWHNYHKNRKISLTASNPEVTSTWPEIGQRGGNMYGSRLAPRLMTRAEQERLLKASGRRFGDFQDHILISLALGTGLRARGTDGPHRRGSQLGWEEGSPAGDLGSGDH
jgi:hypothetical protein